MVDLTQVTQGTTDTSRIGDKIHIHSIEIRHRTYLKMNAPPTSDGQNQCIVRMILFQWKDDSVPTETDILEPIGGNIYTISPYNHDRKVKRKVLFDRTFVISAQISATAGHEYAVRDQVMIKKYISLKKLPGEGITVNYQAASTNGVNKIYMIYFTDTTPPTLNVSGTIRLNFTDI